MIKYIEHAQFVSFMEKMQSSMADCVCFLTSVKWCKVKQIEKLSVQLGKDEALLLYPHFLEQNKHLPN